MVNDAQKYRDSLIGSAPPSKSAQWEALSLPVVELEFLTRTTVVTAA